MDSHPREIPAIGAASTIRRAIIRAGRCGAFPAQAVRELLSDLDHGQPLDHAERRAVLWALCLDINAGHLRAMPAQHAARTLGGWL